MKMLIFLIIIIVTTFNNKVHSYCETSGISDLINEVIPTYFDSTKCIALVYDQNISNLSFDNQVPAFNIHISAETFKISTLKSPMDAGCSGFILLVSDFASIFRKLLETSRYSLQRENRKYFVFLNNNNSDSLNFVFSLPELRFTPDFVLISNNKNGTYSMWTQKFSGENTDDQNIPIVLDLWSTDGGFLYNANLFPDKINNLLGKQLKFATFNYPPYSIIEKGNSDGTEMRLLLELSEQLNFTWSLVTDQHEWGEIYDNASGNGILGSVSEDRAEFGFGALYLWYHEYQFLDFSVPYIRTGITLLAPRPALLSGWHAPTLPFTSKLWLAVGVSQLLAAALICACANLQRAASVILRGSAPSVDVQKLCKPTECILLVLSMTLLVPPRVLPNSAPALKHCLNWFLIQCLLLATSYASSLVSFMTVPRFASPIDTAADVARHSMRWSATHDAWAFSLRQASDPVHSKVYQLFSVMPEDGLAKAATKANKLAFPVERLPAGNFAAYQFLNDENVLKKLRLMGEDLYWEMVVTVVRKGSPYLQPLNNLIQKLSSSGILLFWEGEVSRKFLSSRHQLAIRNSLSAHEVNGPTILAIFHVKGVFLILGIGLFISTCVFIREMLTGSKRYRKKNMFY